jgi:predicted PurR-regulated permease PerM
VNESSNDPVGTRGSVPEAIATALQQPSFLRVMLVLAATVVVLVGIRLGAPILNPIFFGVVLSLLFSPLYSWLKSRGLPSPLALVIMLVVIGTIFLALIFILGVSIGRDSASAWASTPPSSIVRWLISRPSLSDLGSLTSTFAT